MEYKITIHDESETIELAENFENYRGTDNYKKGRCEKIEDFGIENYKKLKEELKDYCTFNPTNGDYLVAYNPSTKLFTVSKIDSNAKPKTRISFNETKSDSINKETVFCLNEKFIGFSYESNKNTISGMYDKIDMIS